MSNVRESRLDPRGRGIQNTPPHRPSARPIADQYIHQFGGKNAGAAKPAGRS